MLVEGELDAAVVTGRELEDPRIRPVISNPDIAAQKWCQRNELVPINHMVVVKAALSKSNPWAVEEIFRLLAESKKIYESSSTDDPDPFPLGVEANRKSLEMIIKYTKQQGIISREFKVDELFDDL
jgi:4,5-dihydroxyphthalate decarboxylase